MVVVVVTPGTRILVEQSIHEVDDETSPHTITALMALAPVDGTFKDKIQLNSMDHGDDGPGVTIKMSRLNHACFGRNNATHYYDDVNKVLICIARTDIAAGDEITFDYTSRFSVSSTAKDQGDDAHFDAALSNSWGIVCPSDCCCKDMQLKQTISRARSLDALMIQYTKRNKIDKALLVAKEILEIENALQAGHSEIFKTLMKAFEAGITSNATMMDGMTYGQQALELATNVFGPSATATVQCRAYVSSPSSHPNYLIHERHK